MRRIHQRMHLLSDTLHHMKDDVESLVDAQIQLDPHGHDHDRAIPGPGYVGQPTFYPTPRYTSPRYTTPGLRFGNDRGYIAANESGIYIGGRGFRFRIGR